MAVTVLIDNIDNDISLQSSARFGTISSDSYYKFYQLKLRQLVTQTRYRKEQDARLARQKQWRNPANENRIPEQKAHREYMNQIRERSKIQVQEILAKKPDDQKKGSGSIASNTNRTMTASVTSTNLPSTIESRSKIISKPRQTPAPPPPKKPRIISAPTSGQKNVNKTRIIPIIKIDGADESLSKADTHSFTQVSSSSARHQNDKTHRHARKSILDTILSHLNSHISTNSSVWPTYEDIDEKFSSSLAPTVYEDFARSVV